ncbi:MAG: hypothetical protein ACQERB_03525 [Promethearchaeati archaeon]
MEKRFKISLIISIIYIIIILFLQFGLPLITGGGLSGDIIPIIPGGAITDLLISISIPYISMLIVLFIGPTLGLIFVYFHRLMRLNKYDYFKISFNKKMPASRILLRVIFPGLLAVNIAIYLSLYGTFNPLFAEDGGNPQNLPIVIEWISIIIGAPIASLVILPLWMLESSGLMCRKKIELYNRPVSPDIESVGKFYSKLLKGFVGISTVTTYGLILFEFFTTTAEFFTIFIVFIDPVVIIFAFTPISLFVELRSPKINERMNSHYEKLNIDITPKEIKIE